MIRKVTMIGKSSMAVSLPSKWAKMNNITKGDEVFVETGDKKLTISLEKEQVKKKEIEIDISGMNNKTIRIYLNHLYRLGFSKITLTSKEEKDIKTIPEIVKNRMTGFETVYLSKNKCVVISIAVPETENTKTIIRRAFLLIKEVAKTTLESCNSLNFKDLDEIRANMLIFDRLNNYIRRAIVLSPDKDKDKSYYLWSIFNKLSLTMHSYFYFYDYAKKQKAKSKELKDIIKEINSLFDDLYEGFYSNNSKIKKLDEKRARINKLIEENIEKHPKESYMYCHLFELARNIQAAGSFTIGKNIVEFSMDPNKQ